MERRKDGDVIQRNRGGWEETHPAESKGGPIGNGPECRAKGRENYSKLGKMEDGVKKSPAVSAPEKPRGALHGAAHPRAPLSPGGSTGSPQKWSWASVQLRLRAVEPVSVCGMGQCIVNF